jgi:hypothetical protein
VAPDASVVGIGGGVQLLSARRFRPRARARGGARHRGRLSLVAHRGAFDASDPANESPRVSFRGSRGSGRRAFVRDGWSRTVPRAAIDHDSPRAITTRVRAAAAVRSARRCWCWAARESGGRDLRRSRVVASPASNPTSAVARPGPRGTPRQPQRDAGGSAADNHHYPSG